MSDGWQETPQAKRKRGRPRLLSEDDCRIAIQLLASRSVMDVAKQFAVSRGTIYNLLKREEEAPE